MNRNLTYKAVVVLGVIVFALVYLAPTVMTLPRWWPNVLPKDKVHLGLDLRGGMNLVLEVEVDKAVESALERTRQDIRRKLDREKVTFTKVDSDKNGGIIITVPSKSNQAKVEDILSANYPGFTLESTKSDAEGNITLVARIKPQESARIREQAHKQALETIRNRVDQFGVAEPEIVPLDDWRIQVQLPGVKDPTRAKRLIGKTAQLVFKLVAPATVTKDTMGPDMELSYLYSSGADPGTKVKQPIILYKRGVMTGETITDARVQIDSQFNEPYVSCSFDARGADLFGKITSENVKERLAIVMDGKVQSAPVIQEPITGGECRITGSFTMEEARDLSVVLRSGALPAPVKILSEENVGPSLGQDSINQGVTSMMVGMILVLLIILFYYRFAGIVANLALLLNMVLMVAALAAFQATLTLPGIAGIIMTIGMAVDANVLIFERIREEVRLGKTPAAAVEAGYGKATLTIIDANVTTLIAALVLYQFGTGPVRGFAVTLSIGIVSSLFTAITFTRLVFDYVLLRFKPNKLSI